MGDNTTLHARHPAAARGRRRGRAVPLRRPARLLRADRHQPGGDAALARRAGPPRRRLRPRRAALGQRQLRGARAPTPTPGSRCGSPASAGRRSTRPPACRCRVRTPAVGARRWLWPAVAGAALVAAVAGAVALAARRRRRAPRPWEAQLLDRLEGAGGRRGRPRRIDETLAEYTRALGRGVLADRRLDEAAEIVARSRFAPGGVDAEERQRAEQLVDEAIAAAPKSQRAPRRPAPVGESPPTLVGGERRTSATRNASWPSTTSARCSGKERRSPPRPGAGRSTRRCPAARSGTSATSSRTPHGCNAGPRWPSAAEVNRPADSPSHLRTGRRSPTGSRRASPTWWPRCRPSRTRPPPGTSPASNRRRWRSGGGAWRRRPRCTAGTPRLRPARPGPFGRAGGGRHRRAHGLLRRPPPRPDRGGRRPRRDRPPPLHRRPRRVDVHGPGHDLRGHRRPRQGGRGPAGPGGRAAARLVGPPSLDDAERRRGSRSSATGRSLQRWLALGMP